MLVKGATGRISKDVCSLDPLSTEPITDVTLAKGQLQYKISVWNSSWTQISRNLVGPLHTL